MLTPSSLNCTPAMAFVPDAVAATVMVLLTVALVVGEVMLTVGAVGGVTFATVIVTGLLVVVRLLLLVATAVTVCVPLVTVLLSQLTLYGLVVSAAPTLTPSTLNWTDETATASDALAVRVVAPVTVLLAAGAVTDTVGAVGFATVIVTGLLVVVRLLLLVATAVTVCVPLATVLESQLMLYGLVVSAAPTLTPSTLNWTDETATASDALAVSVVVPVTLALATGAVTLTVGAVGGVVVELLTRL